ncbi:MAG: SNF2 family N-terminal domain-containing protein, partial [Olpidium bornovanus]
NRGAPSGTAAQASQSSKAAPGSATHPYTQAQLSALRLQIMAYKFISRNLPLPGNLQEAVFSLGPPVSSIPAVSPASGDLSKKIVEAAVTHHEPPPATSAPAQKPTKFPAIAQKYSGFSPAYAQLKKTLAHNARQQRMIVPVLNPVGLDPIALAQERERQIRTRIDQRIRELEEMPSNLSNEALGGPMYFDDAMLEVAPSGSSKLKALIELKALRLLGRQRRLREEMVKGMTRATTLVTQGDRAAYRRMKKQSLREARMTERLERQQRAERDRREKQKHHDFLATVLNHRTEMTRFHLGQQNRVGVLTRKVMAYHNTVEKEEAKKADRMSKARLSALKNDDEEAYLKLVDQAKDTRITHLLQQTDEYLNNLAQSVRAQQADELHSDPTMRGGVELMDDEGQAFEEAKVKRDYYGEAHRIKEVVHEQPSILVGGALKEYQLKGLQWMVSLYNNRLNGILADEMGLGKTIQTISLITHLMEVKKQNGPFLIIVPLSTLTNWTLEFEKWAPSVSKIVYKGVPSQRKALQAEVRQMNFHVLLTTYEYIIKDRPTLAKVKWVHMIIDEGHRMKNTQSKLTMVLTQYYTTRYRLILTGTPLQNNLPELWALLNFVLPRIFNSVKSFDEWFNPPFSSQGGQEKIALTEEEQLLVIKRLHKVLRPFLLRRLKKDVEAELPDKVERIVKCRMSALQVKLYNQMKSYGMLYTTDGIKGKSGVKGLNNTIMQLRKICNHPYVFEDVERLINPANMNDEKLYRVSGKFELLDRILPKFFRTGHRVLIFFQMTTIMTIMEDFLHFRGYKYLRLDGTIKADDRSELLRQFNDPESDVSVFLLSTRAGGLGLNLQTADTVIIFDSDWNPHQDLQAQDRAHRIGQTKEVRILRLITEKSVEENILARAQYKLDIDGKVIQAGKFDNKTSGEDRDALLVRDAASMRALLANDPEENDANETEVMDDEEINEVIARSDEEAEIFREMDREREQAEEQQWRARGNWGPPAPRLIQENELPKVYLRDIGAEERMRQVESAEEEFGKGRRVRTAVQYADGLTDEQWMEAMQNEEMDAEEALNQKVHKKRLQMEKRAKKRAAQEARERSEPREDGALPEGEEYRDEQADEDEEGSLSSYAAGSGRSSPSRSGASTPRDRRQSRISGASADADEGSEARKRRGRRKREDDDEGASRGDTPVSFKKKAVGKTSEPADEVPGDLAEHPMRAHMRTVLTKVLQSIESLVAED